MEEIRVTMSKIQRAGVIPYVIEDDTIKMLFMVPSDPAYGGDKPQIAKGQIDKDEDPEQAAIREGSEELGLFPGNIEQHWKLGKFVSIHTYVARVKNKDMFGDTDHETKSTHWMSWTEFKQQGRELHRPAVGAAHRSIKTQEDNPRLT